MLIAALVSLHAWNVPHSSHNHALIRNPSKPLGPVRFLQTLQVTVVYDSFITSNTTPAFAHLYPSMVLN